MNRRSHELKIQSETSKLNGSFQARVNQKAVTIDTNDYCEINQDDNQLFSLATNNSILLNTNEYENIDENSDNDLANDADLTNISYENKNINRILVKDESTSRHNDNELTNESVNSSKLNINEESRLENEHDYDDDEIVIDDYSCFEMRKANCNHSSDSSERPNPLMSTSLKSIRLQAAYMGSENLPPRSHLSDSKSNSPPSNVVSYVKNTNHMHSNVKNNDFERNINFRRSKRFVRQSGSSLIMSHEMANKMHYSTNVNQKTASALATPTNMDTNSAANSSQSLLNNSLIKAKSTPSIIDNLNNEKIQIIQEDLLEPNNLDLLINSNSSLSNNKEKDETREEQQGKMSAERKLGITYIFIN